MTIKVLVLISIIVTNAFNVFLIGLYRGQYIGATELIDFSVMHDVHDFLSRYYLGVLFAFFLFVGGCFIRLRIISILIRISSLMLLFILYKNILAEAYVRWELMKNEYFILGLVSLFLTIVSLLLLSLYARQRSKGVVE